MAAGHLISRVTILGTGLIGGSFALALRKYTTGMHISGWDRPDIVRKNTYALIAESAEAVVAGLKARAATVEEPEATHDPRIGAFVKILEKVGARPLWLGAPQHDYAVGLASHLPQLAAVALASFLYDRLDENGLPITLAGPGLRDSLRLAGSPYS